MLLTVANLDRMGPPRPKNPHRISIWAYEVSIACSQCLKPEPVVQSRAFWKRIFSCDSSTISSPSPTKTSSTKGTSPIKMPSLLSKPSISTTSPPTSPTSPNTFSTSTTNTLTMTLSKQHQEHQLFHSSLPLHLSSHNDEMPRTAMYAPDLEAEWAYDDWGEDENGESSLDMASSESGAGWGARDRAQRLDRAERLLNTNDKKTKMAAMRHAASAGVGA